GQILLVGPGVGPIMPGSLDERVVFPFDRFDTLRAFEDREVRLPRDPRDFPQHVPPIRDQVEHMIRRGDIERSGDEWKSCRVREDNIPQTFCETELDHLPRDVDADDANATLLKWHGVATRADPDLKDPFSAKLVHEDREDAGHRAGCESACLVVDGRDAVEGQSARHRISHGRADGKMCPAQRPNGPSREATRTVSARGSRVPDTPAKPPDRRGTPRLPPV